MTDTTTTDRRAFWTERMRALPPTITYESSREYRAIIRRVFDFDAEKRVTEFGGVGLDPEVPMDAETADEVAFDEAAMTRALVDWYSWTEDDPDFLEVYEHAAYTMMTTDPTVGQCVATGYSTFADYYACMRAFLLETDRVGADAQNKTKRRPDYGGAMARLQAYFRPKDRGDD